MKPPLPLLKLTLLFFALFCAKVAWAQNSPPTPVAQNLDVFFGETKELPLDRPIDDFSITPEDVVKVDRVDSAPNELSLVGLAGGNATLTVKSAGRTLLYDITVSPKPERVYINLNESKRLSFENPIDDTTISQQGIVRVVQPDSSDRVLLIEANTPGKTTLTVYSKGQIFRYFISTFDNRGADVLQIQNAFSAKGYRNLTITFDKDQAILGGTVPTQEELDDAVRIVKQFTDFVVVKANLGQEIEQSEYSEQESIIINNIQRIANVRGLTVRVKFPAPTVITTSTFTKSVGDYVDPGTTTTPQGGTIRGSGFQPPADPNKAGPTGTGPLEAKPQENTTETTTTTKNTPSRKKSFSTATSTMICRKRASFASPAPFAPLLFPFLPSRTPSSSAPRSASCSSMTPRPAHRLRLVQWRQRSDHHAGLRWPAPLYESRRPGGRDVRQLFHPRPLGRGQCAGRFQSLRDALGLSKLLRETELFLTNGQPGWYSEGEVQSYVSSSVTTASSPPLTTLTASAIFLGVNMDISPLNLVSAGGVEPAGQKIFGVPGRSAPVPAALPSRKTAIRPPIPVSKVNRAIQTGGVSPIVDNTVKYVDENGLIGLNISTQMTLPNGPINSVSNRVYLGADAGSNNDYITLPDFFVRTTRTRVNLRDGQTVAINGLIDQQTIHNITGIPFLQRIPILGALFRDTSDSSSRE